MRAPSGALTYRTTPTPPSNATTSGYYGIPSISISTPSWNQTSSHGLQVYIVDKLELLLHLALVLVFRGHAVGFGVVGAAVKPFDYTDTIGVGFIDCIIELRDYTNTIRSEVVGPFVELPDHTIGIRIRFINAFVELPDHANTIKLDSLHALLDSIDLDKHAKLVIFCVLFPFGALFISCTLVVFRALVIYIHTVAAGLHTYHHQNAIQLNPDSHPTTNTLSDSVPTSFGSSSKSNYAPPPTPTGTFTDGTYSSWPIDSPTSTPSTPPGTYTDATNSSWDVPPPTPSTLSTVTSPRSSSAVQSETDGYYGPPQPTLKTGMNKRVMQGIDNDDGVAKMNVAADGAMQMEANEKPKKGQVSTISPAFEAVS
ncbi:hypothetical protein N0V95_004241 [Ascochyta clinopodiicola]|nr:hypothetical protein N0V95_004241 [Ascochyta clinopodiicola]